MKNILITGGSGYLGHGLVETLLADGAERVCIMSRSEWRQAEMRAAFRDDNRLRFFIGDVRDRERVARAMHGIDTVIHAAALKRVEVGEYNADEMARTNVFGTMNVLYEAEAHEVERFVLVSSDKAYQPVNAYGASKLMAERIVLGGHELRGNRLPRVAVCRYGNVAGSTGSVIPIWRKCLEHGLRAKVTNPNATRFWMTRFQAVDLVLGTVKKMEGGELMIPDLPAFSVRDLANAMGVDWRFVGMGNSEKMHEAMDDERRSNLVRQMSVEEIKEALQHVN
jgi:UDP-N-acetylglucosamine 4,6-dehydratase